jgi:sorting nexin-1/2
VLDAKQEFDQASRIVKTELARFEQERVEDFRDSLQAFLSGMIDRQKEVRYLLISLPECIAHAHHSFIS